MQKFIRFILFAVFFAVGMAAVYLSFVCDELSGCYKKQQQLADSKITVEKFSRLNADYARLISELEDDPNVAGHIAVAVLGVKDNDSNVVYPRATAEQLAAAKKTLTERQPVSRKPSVIAGWLKRCRDIRRRIILFSAGAVLVLVSFIYFGPAGNK